MCVFHATQFLRPWFPGTLPQLALAVSAFRAAARPCLPDSDHATGSGVLRVRSGLGRVLGIAFGVRWYAPWAIFHWQEAFGANDPGFMEQAITQSQALFLCPQFLLLAVWFTFMKKLKGDARLHGSARWANEKEIRRMGYMDGKGVYVGGWVKHITGFAYWSAVARRAVLVWFLRSYRPPVRRERQNVPPAQRPGTRLVLRAYPFR